MEFLITAIVAVILLVGVASSCPSVCNCTDTSDGINVDCNKGGLYSIPTDLPNNTYRLLIGNNDISVIEENAFKNLPYLQSLDLGRNDISEIENNTFNNLPNLETLFMYYNKITSIKSYTFNLINLREFHFDHNEISVIENNTFNNLPNLQYIHLNDNKITSVKSGTFRHLQQLYQLTLGNNYISFVSEKAFVNLPWLTSLEFDMYCVGCDNIPFWRWLKINQKYTSVTCNDYDGESLAKLEPNNFTDCFMDPCYSNPCLNNGLCTNDGKGSALCSCHGDWTGSQCELSPCSTVVCNDGECYYNESGIAKCFNQAATKSDDYYTAVYTGVGTFVATALGAVIIVLVTLRYKRKKKQQERRTKDYITAIFFDDYVNNGVHNTEAHCVATIPVVQEQHYDTIQN